MRKRYQQGSLRKVDGKWIAQWWEDGHRRKRTLGRVSEVPKAKAKAELNAILAPVNGRARNSVASDKFGEFVLGTFLPKESRLSFHVLTPNGRLAVSLGMNFKIYSMKKPRRACRSAQ